MDVQSIMDVESQTSDTQNSEKSEHPEKSRNQGLQYIYIGFNKCGTKSIAAAFKLLGFKVYDYEENIVYLNKEWRKFVESKLSTKQRLDLLRKMYENVDVAVEGPCTFYWKELLEIFPDCKAIFYERETESWYKLVLLKIVF